MDSHKDRVGSHGAAERQRSRAHGRARAQPSEDGAAHHDDRALRLPRANARVWGSAWVALVPARRTTGAWLSVVLPCYHVPGAEKINHCVGHILV